MIYLATPYSHPEPEIREARYKQALWLTNYFLSSGQKVFSPIVYGHHITKEFSPDKYEAVHWENWNNHVINRCEELWYHNLDLLLPSSGVGLEIRYAQRQGIEVKERFEKVPSEYDFRSDRALG